MINFLSLEISWDCKNTWKQASINTLWCLLGCLIGDFGTIGFFQFFDIDFPIIYIMMLAIINGLITSILLETIILLRKMTFQYALKTALGMSIISMISMEIVMNLVDYLYTGDAKLNFTVVPLMLFFGFLTPLPYNYWRLKKYGKACH